MKNKINKILIIISFITVGLGLFIGIGLSTELMQGIFNSKDIYVDGSNFTGLFQIFSSASSIILGVLTVIFSFIFVGILWTLYGIILLIIKITKK